MEWGGLITASRLAEARRAGQHGPAEQSGELGNNYPDSALATSFQLRTINELSSLAGRDGLATVRVRGVAVRGGADRSWKCE